MSGEDLILEVFGGERCVVLGGLDTLAEAAAAIQRRREQEAACEAIGRSPDSALLSIPESPQSAEISLINESTAGSGMRFTARNGDVWTGERDGDWWMYRDAQGCLYESKEIPANREWRGVA